MATVYELLEIARGELGVKESPASSNRVKYNTWYYGREVRDTARAKYPWCMVFVQWVFHQAGASALLPNRTASCSNLMTNAKKKGCWVTGTYQPGDLAIFDWQGDGKADHVGIVEKALGGGVYQTIEGNTSVGNDSNGGQVMRRQRKRSQILGAVRPDYEDGEDKQVVRYKYLRDIPAAFRPTIEKLMDAGIIQGDGSDSTGNWDIIDLSHDMVREFVISYRGGAFDRRLIAAGLEPAVKA